MIAVQIQTIGGFGRESHATERGVRRILQAVSGKPGLERTAPAVGDQAGVDLELAAERKEEPRALGPDPLGFGSHAP